MITVSSCTLTPNSRVGWTVDEAQKGLGEEKYSYGYGGTGKSSTNNSFNDYGETYGPGDIIGCFVVSTI